MKKRLFMILLIAVFINAMSFASKITVEEPHAAYPLLTWLTGHTYIITWTRSGSMDAFVKIKLLRKIKRRVMIFGMIVDMTPNDGSCIWEVPKSLETGTYYIYIETIDNSVRGTSGAFIIRNPELDKKRAMFAKTAVLSPHTNLHIRIIEPKASTTWFEGKRYNIIWNNIYTKGKHIKIGLYNFNGKSLIKVIYDGNDVLSPTTGKSESTYSWIVPKGLGSFTGKRYKIKIYTIGGTKSIKGSVDITIKVPISLHSK